MIGKVVLFGALVGVVTRAHAQPRLEASVGGGTDDASNAELRTSARRGTLDFALVGALANRSDREERGASAELDRTTDASQLRVVGVLTDRTFDLATANAGFRQWALGGAWGLDRGVVAGASFEGSDGTTTDIIDPSMPVFQRVRHADHRFLEAYLKDTLHVIETLDVSGGFVFDDWRNLSAIETIRYGTDEAMEIRAPDVDDIQISPAVGAVYRATDHVALHASGYRELRPPTIGELYVPLADIDANHALHAESRWVGEVGPEVHAGAFAVRAAGFRHEVDAPIAVVDGAYVNLDHARVTGVATTASWRPTEAVLASVAYTLQHSDKPLAFAPRHRASAQLAVDAPRIATLTSGVRVLDTTALVDAMAARRLPHGLAGFVSVENLLDRRYVGADDLPGVARTIQIGVRLDTARL